MIFQASCLIAAFIEDNLNSSQFIGCPWMASATMRKTSERTCSQSKKQEVALKMVLAMLTYAEIFCTLSTFIEAFLQEAAAEAVAAAMNATLPGIDANDEGKTRAVFRFYCMILASTSSLVVSN